MDYLDPRKAHRDKVLLFVGYFLMTIVVTLTTIILFYVTEGFGFGKNGSVIQNGLLFFSSQPNPANIYINNKLQSSQTNTSMLLPAGNYKVSIKQTGYWPWQRNILVNGGTVERFDYPFLFPKHLVTSTIGSFSGIPNFASQSLDRHWLIVENPNQFGQFFVYDLTKPLIPPTTITIPTSVLSASTASQSWQLVSWSNDNKHVVLNHIFGSQNEFILVDINNGSLSVNLTKTFSNISFNSLSLINEQFNQYDLYNSTTDQLVNVSLANPLIINSTLSQVLAYKTYSNNVILYATTLNAPNGKVSIDEQIGTKIYIIKTTSPSPSYLLDLTNYNSIPYLVIGQTNDPKIFIYQDPVSQINSNPSYVPAPLQGLVVPGVNYVSFSDNAQFIMAENMNHFAVYNIESGYAYNYIIPQKLQAPQTNATWMDGDRLIYTANNHLIVFDYDGINFHQLMPANPNYLSYFNTNYSYVYSLANKNNKIDLTQTSLIAP